MCTMKDLYGFSSVAASFANVHCKDTQYFPIWQFQNLRTCTAMRGCWTARVRSPASSVTLCQAGGLRDFTAVAWFSSSESGAGVRQPSAYRNFSGTAENPG